MAPMTLLLGLLSVMVLAGLVFGGRLNAMTRFEQNYEIQWGRDHVSFGGSDIQLSLDQASGSRFGSKLDYGSGYFHMKIKLHHKDSGGVVTAYYLSSNTSKHDELDFEFLGNREGRPITLQTNVFANGVGNREQRFHLWFDPTADFHDYAILWNPFHVVFYVDGNPIRTFENQSNRGLGYPSQPMEVTGSLWNGEDWATDGGKTRIDWSHAPFTAHFQGFNIDGCASDASSYLRCSSPHRWWNTGAYRGLTPAQNIAMQTLRKRYMTYDYCSDRGRYSVPPPECPQ